ncbi:ATP synthase subunit I [Alkalicoccus daliensis]|uniref:ATP synthase protein I n=1 Tax=Alkalicoccus daliensis TaxID=745820 RepID=A0A1H0GLJ1_9BACI|nr:ATP synthase subunit I [Alkalicoccus daliensis]SDO07785.1 ATP synthase protein I [Alkalicoccus daliensis]
MTTMYDLARRYSIYTGIIILLLLTVALVTSMSTFFFGMAFGTALSLVNFVSTYFQVKRLAETERTQKYRFSIGTVGRLIIVLAALFIAQAFPQYFDMAGVIAGLAVTYVILLIDPIFQIKHLQ